MSRPDQDPEIAAAFSALREEEERQCPPFAEVVRRPRRSMASLRYLVAATAVAIAALAVWIVLRSVRPPETVPSLAEWRSPTGFLLETPGREVLSAPPGLGRSVLDLASPTTRRSSS